MKKYYTRACNFYYGNHSKKLIKEGHTLPLCGNNKISFDKIELIIRKNRKKITSKIINIKDIKKLKKNIKNIVFLDLKTITSKRKNFLKRINFLNPSIMGILNLTPDSFSDGGKFNSTSKAKKHIKNMVAAGASVIDIGGESTRPGSKEISQDLEWKRLKNILKNFKRDNKNILLSLDTRKSKIMKKSCHFGVDIINDVSGFNHDSETLITIKSLKKTNIIHHMQGTPNTMQTNPRYTNVLLDIYDFFKDKINSLKNNKKIILDPGIGFGKKLKHNLTLISKISLFHSLGFPILVGTSRKRFIGQLVKN